MDGNFIRHLKGEIIEKVLGKQQSYVAALIPELSNQIVTETLQYLAAEASHQEDSEAPQYKWIVQLNIIEKTPKGSSGFYTQAGALLDASRDTTFECRWESKALICTCWVFRIHLP